MSIERFRLWFREYLKAAGIPLRRAAINAGIGDGNVRKCANPNYARKEPLQGIPTLIKVLEANGVKVDIRLHVRAGKVQGDAVRPSIYGTD